MEYIAWLNFILLESNYKHTDIYTGIHTTISFSTIICFISLLFLFIHFHFTIIWFILFHSASFRFILSSFRFISYSFRFISSSFRFISLHFASFRFISLHFASFRILVGPLPSYVLNVDYCCVSYFGVCEKNWYQMFFRAINFQH